MALSTSAYSPEIVRGGLLAVPFGQIEAARGMSGAVPFRRVIFSIALRQVLPAYSTEVILMTKATALAGIVTLKELMFVARKLNSQTDRAIEIVLCVGAIDLVMNIVIARIVAPGGGADVVAPARRARFAGPRRPFELGAIR